MNTTTRVFNSDVNCHGGYRYSTNAPFSVRVANTRITQETYRLLPKKAKRIIDIGCGDGNYTAELALQHPNRNWEGFDPAIQAIKLAQSRYPHARFFVGDILTHKGPSKKYDVAIVRGVIHHLDNPAKGIRNCARWSNTVIIIEPNGNNLILKMIEKTFHYHRAHDEQSFSPSVLRNWCHKAGFKVVTQSYIGFVPFFCPKPIAYVLYMLQPYLEQIPWLARYGSAQIVMVCKR